MGSYADEYDDWVTGKCDVCKEKCSGPRYDVENWADEHEINHTGHTVQGV